VRRVCIFGASGSGKTTLGRWLAGQRNLRFVDLDDLHWLPGWVERATADFRDEVDRVTRGPAWVVAGNYSEARDLLWPRADTLVWLDLALPRVLWRTSLRVFRQAYSGEPICNGNRQRIGALVFGSDSLLGHTLRTYHARRREWPAALSQPRHARAIVYRLRSPREVAAWRASVQAGNTPVER
jgi:hypothetical protein